MAKILIVDDSEDNRALLAYLLDRVGGHTAVLAGGGEAGVDAAAAEKPDLILMDLAMPGVDGHAAARLIRKQEALASTPILAMSAVYDTPLDYRGGEAGLFDAFFHLPMDIRLWLSEIESYLPPAALAESAQREEGDA